MNLQGAEAALVAMVRQSGPALVTKLPRLWERMSRPLLEHSAAATPSASAPPAQAAAEAQVPFLSQNAGSDYFSHCPRTHKEES